MVFSSVLLLAAANMSADVCQYLASYPERLSSQQVLELICCIPLQRLGRLALCLWTFFCFPPPSSYYTSSSDDSDSSSASDYDVDDSHSD